MIYSFIVPAREMITVDISAGEIHRHTYDWFHDNSMSIANLWNHANWYAESQLDVNSRISVLWYLMDPQCPQSRKEKIIAVQMWWKSLWDHYSIQKARALNGEEAYFDPEVVGPCPYTIWDISE